MRPLPRLNRIEGEVFWIASRHARIKEHSERTLPADSNWKGKACRRVDNITTKSIGDHFQPIHGGHLDPSFSSNLSLSATPLLRLELL